MENNSGVLFGAVLAFAPAWAVEVTTRGQEVVQGVLTPDLACTGHPGAGRHRLVTIGVTVACADVIAQAGDPPNLSVTTCDTRYVQGSGVPGDNWGVCTLD